MEFNEYIITTNSNTSVIIVIENHCLIEVPDEFLLDPFVNIAYEKFHFILGLDLVCGRIEGDQDYPISELLSVINEIQLDDDYDFDELDYDDFEDEGIDYIKLKNKLFIGLKCSIIDDDDVETYDLLKRVISKSGVDFDYDLFSVSFLNSLFVKGIQNEKIKHLIDIYTDETDGKGFAGLAAVTSVLPQIDYRRLKDKYSIERFVEESEEEFIDLFDLINDNEPYIVSELVRMYKTLGLLLDMYEKTTTLLIPEQWSRGEVMTQTTSIGKLIIFPPGYFKKREK